MPEKRRDDFVNARKLLIAMTFARRRGFSGIKKLSVAQLDILPGLP